MRKAVVLVLDRPTILSEIAGSITNTLGRDKPPKITTYIKDMEKDNILKKLTPKHKSKKPGAVYGLTDQGKKIKKMLCIQDKAYFSYHEPEKIDWHAYGWCLTGRQKKAIILILGRKPKRQVEIKTKIREKYKNRNDNPGVTFQNLNDILQLMVKRRIVSVEEETVKKHKKKRKKYKLTTKGLRIQGLMLFPQAT